MTGTFVSLTSNDRNNALPQNYEYQVSLKSQHNNHDHDHDSTSQTASSEDSPIRAENRVRRAAKLAAKAYLEDVQLKVMRVEKATLEFEQC